MDVRDRKGGEPPAEEIGARAESEPTRSRRSIPACLKVCPDTDHTCTTGWEGSLPNPRRGICRPPGIAAAPLPRQIRTAPTKACYEVFRLKRQCHCVGLIFPQACPTVLNTRLLSQCAFRRWTWPFEFHHGPLRDWSLAFFPCGSELDSSCNSVGVGSAAQAGRRPRRCPHGHSG